jgi:glycogen(starch) synthase
MKSAPIIKQGEAEASAPLLCEVSWEVCQQAGGIYTVLRSKAPAMVLEWGARYCLVGPWNPQSSPAEFEETKAVGEVGAAVRALQARGFGVKTGIWLVTGRPRVVLLDPQSVVGKLGEIEYLLWEHHHIGMLGADPLAHQVTAFGFLAGEFFRALAAAAGERKIIGHFHEWMAGSAIPELRRERVPVGIVFTTHATLLGRYLAMQDSGFYDHVPFVDWRADARRFNVEPQVLLERAAAHGAHVFTTVSDITAFECEHLLGRKPDLILPNGLNIQRFAAVHEFQNLHRVYKDKINQFTMGHFFPSYTFDLDRTLYFFTSGRYEYVNKGFDLTLDAMVRLNERLKAQSETVTVVFFIVTRRPSRSVNADVLQKQAVLQEIRSTCEAIKDQVGERLFAASAEGTWPRLDGLVDEYWRLRLRRTLLAWKTPRLPAVVTHDLEDDGNDEVLNKIRACALFNRPEDRVKVVYHPDFVSAISPLLGMDYDQFVRGCHMGLFPSYYEPWGYAPLEAMALGVPAVTSDLAGFGTYVQREMDGLQQRGVRVIHRRHNSYETAVQELMNVCLNFVKLDRRERIALRNEVESASVQFDWGKLGRYYGEAHAMALSRF